MEMDFIDGFDNVLFSESEVFEVGISMWSVTGFFLSEFGSDKVECSRVNVYFFYESDVIVFKPFVEELAGYLDC